MMTTAADWFEELRKDRELWVYASARNRFERGIWNATVEKYADPVHFLFELMQNAEDEGASQAELVIREDAIVFEHNGSSFDRDDVDGITGIGNTTKLEEANKIGCFGIGFKSVYVISDRPEVHTWVDGEPFAFAITDLVVPTRIPHEGRAGWTRFVLPLRAGSHKVATRLRNALREIGPRSMLFLDRLRHLGWTDGHHRECYTVEQHEGGGRTLRRIDDARTTGVERYLVLSRPVVKEGSKSDLFVKIALRQDLDGTIIRTPGITKLAVFFETEEATGLFFHVHGPFKLTDNRANIKRGDLWNDHLVGEVGRLFVGSLPSIRDAGLLKRSFMDVLPNANDGLAAPWAALLDHLVIAFRTEALVPAHFGGHLAAPKLVRGPADLRDLVGDDGLQRLSGKGDLRWSVTGLKNNREDAFLASLGITEWGVANFTERLTRGLWYGTEKQISEWFDALPDHKLQRLYLLLDGAIKNPAMSSLIQSAPIVRLESGRRVRVADALLPPAGVYAEGEVDANDLPLVKETLIRGGRGRGKEVEQFLQRMRMQVVGERHYLAAIVKRFYKGGSAPGLTAERHMKHVRRFMAWWKEHRNIVPFENALWLRAEGHEGYHSADRLYLDKPYAETGLTGIYDGSEAALKGAPVWSGYARLKREDFVGLMVAAGVRTELVITKGWIPREHPEFRELKGGFAGARETGTGIDQDHMIEGLTTLLSRRNPSISAVIWRTVSKQRPEVMKALYRPNQQYTLRSAPSSLAYALDRAAWVPTKDGTLKMPRSVTAAELAEGYEYAGNEAWLDVLGFGAEHQRQSEQAQGRRKAAEAIGLPPEFADALQEVPTAERPALFADLLRRMRERPAPSPAFPERSSANPERRARKIAERGQTAPEKTYEKRERSVRTSDADTQPMAKEYLRDLYTNEANDMICQCCHGAMPFRMPDGRPYFEAVEYLTNEARELQENHLAFCPNCAAKWRYVNGESRESLIEAVRDAKGLHTTPTLAGERIQLRFVEVHLQDLRALLSPDGDAGEDLASTPA